ncbi:6273_t:CDS:2 [Acaulospora colombiana]|uniref:6273_t:CDS:1 n=1 Tax=Acaulospora colombiana TaxID=27376 RepID=A0ACA9JWW8_9GLOM|nr:6273_t:CDS:2 [Acaulospora colombiana]
MRLSVAYIPAAESGLVVSSAVVLTEANLRTDVAEWFRMEPRTPFLMPETTGFGGTPMAGSSKFSPDRLVPEKDSRRIKVTFNADRSRALPWSFTPQQREVRVLPGETALAFYTAKNDSDQDIIGIATYNVTPFKVAPYFNKIQCFCFEEQKLEAGEEVDMPVFFFIDPEFNDDPLMKDVDTITLSYTFFKGRNTHSVSAVFNSTVPNLIS